MDHNINYNPEAFGFEKVSEWEFSSNYYEFDTRIVLRRKRDGKLFTARDSGCSCPTPFEDTTVESLDPFNEEDLLSEAKIKSEGERYEGDSFADIKQKIHDLTKR